MPNPKLIVNQLINLGGIPVVITTIGTFGSTQHYGFVSDCSYDGPLFAGWIPCVVAEAIHEANKSHHAAR